LEFRHTKIVNDGHNEIHSVVVKLKVLSIVLCCFL